MFVLGSVDLLVHDARTDPCQTGYSFDFGQEAQSMTQVIAAAEEMT